MVNTLTLRQVGFDAGPEHVGSMFNSKHTPYPWVTHERTPYDCTRVQLKMRRVSVLLFVVNKICQESMFVMDHKQCQCPCVWQVSVSPMSLYLASLYRTVSRRKRRNTRVVDPVLAHSGCMRKPETYLGSWRRLVLEYSGYYIVTRNIVI